MTQIMMIYKIPKGDDKLRIKFNRKLFHYKTTTHSGKYLHITKGILSNFSKPLRSTIIFTENKLKIVKQLCDKLKIESKFYKIQEIKS